MPDERAIPSKRGVLDDAAEINSGPVANCANDLPPTPLAAEDAPVRVSEPF